jgi:hypothetical protein
VAERPVNCHVRAGPTRSPEVGGPGSGSGRHQARLGAARYRLVNRWLGLTVNERRNFGAGLRVFALGRLISCSRWQAPRVASGAAVPEMRKAGTASPSVPVSKSAPQAVDRRDRRASGARSNLAVGSRVETGGLPGWALSHPALEDFHMSTNPVSCHAEASPARAEPPPLSDRGQHATPLSRPARLRFFTPSPPHFCGAVIDRG